MTENRRFVEDIPVRPTARRKGTAEPAGAAPRAGQSCAVKGCEQKGEYRAPLSPLRLDEYQWLCLTHIREHNAHWDFFRGMSASDVEKYLKDNLVGHRPTWSMGVNKAKTGESFAKFSDPLGIFGKTPNSRAKPEPEPSRHVGSLTKQALDTLELDESATLKDVKARYKELVKQFHPDANGGDRSCEDRLKRVIRAYRTLRASNFA